MQELFHRDQRTRELREIRARLPKVREEIARLEAYLDEIPTSGATDATQTALQLRAVLTRSELEGLRKELRTLLGRQAELEGAMTAARPTPLAEQALQPQSSKNAVFSASPEPTVDHGRVAAEAMLDTLATPAAALPARVAARAAVATGVDGTAGRERSPRHPWARLVGTAVIGTGLLLLGYTVGYVGGRQSIVIPAMTPQGVAVGLVPSLIVGTPTLLAIATQPPAPSPPPIPAASTPGPASVESPAPTDPVAAPDIDVGEVDDELPEDESLATQVVGSTVVIVPVLRLRAAPALTADLAALLGFGTQLQVLNGSAAADNYEWLSVRTPEGVEGWIVVDGVSAAR